jgi:taspase (threonine aspartase 1)
MFGSKRGRKGNEIACIFVHAGAGFHSIQNEHVHLQACNEYGASFQKMVSIR